MFLSQRRRYEMFLKVIDFILAQVGSFPSGSIGEEIFASLQTLTATIAGLAGQQISAKGEFGMVGDIKGNTRDALYLMLLDISGIATTLAYTIAGLENKFRLPYNRSSRNLIAAGRAFATDAPEYKAEFMRGEMKGDFITELIAATDALEQALAEAGAAEQSKIGSTASFAPHIKQGMIDCRRLDPIIKKMFRNDAAALAAWTFARHVERTALKPKTPPNP